MRDIKELKSAFKDLSKLIIGSTLSLIIVSFYIIQRNCTSIAELNLKVLDNKLIETQGEVGGLNFQYGMMNIYWPLVIVEFYLNINFLVKKQNGIWTEIKEESGKSSLNFDSYNLYREVFSDKLSKSLIYLLLNIPILSLLLHLIVPVSIAIYLYGGEYKGEEDYKFLQFVIIAQLIITTLSLIILIKVPQKIFKRINGSYI